MTDTVSRTIRFKTEDVELIDEFIEKNPIFDFSSLTRIALRKFIENPTVEFTPISNKNSLLGQLGRGAKQ